MLLVYLAQQRQTVHFRHVDVRQDDVNIRMLLKYVQGFETVVGKEKLIFALTNLTTKILRQQQFEVCLIINTQNLYSIHSCLSCL